MRDKVTRQCPQNLWNERRAETDSNRGPSAYQPTALMLGQTALKLVCTQRVINCTVIYCPLRQSDNQTGRELCIQINYALHPKAKADTHVPRITMILLFAHFQIQYSFWGSLPGMGFHDEQVGHLAYRADKWITQNTNQRRPTKPIQQRNCNRFSWQTSPLLVVLIVQSLCAYLHTAEKP